MIVVTQNLSKFRNGTLGKGISGGACDSDIRAHGLMMMYQDDTVTFARVSASEQI